jgi:hypothetical protein
MTAHFDTSSQLKTQLSLSKEKIKQKFNITQNPVDVSSIRLRHSLYKTRVYFRSLCALLLLSASGSNAMLQAT